MRVNTNARGSRAGADGSKLQQLRRSVMANLLWENQFYEDGVSIAERIKALSAEVTPEQLAAVAVEARDKHNLRHVPLLLATQLVKHGAGKTGLVSDTIQKIVQRADELSELVALYWADGKKPLSSQMKKGLAKAFTKFNAYSLAKYNRDAKVKLRDVLFLVHPKAKDAEQQKVFDQLASNTLAAPDTWEVALSGGANQKETWTRLLQEGKLGYLALLRNLRNMSGAGVDRKLVKEAILARKGAEKVLPFRFTAAARHAPEFEPELDKALIAGLESLPKLEGRTLVLVDNSGSMYCNLSGKSDLQRIDAAATLASILPSNEVEVWVFADSHRKVPARKGMAGVDAIKQGPRGGTNLSGTVAKANAVADQFDRIIVITDEQDTTYRPVPSPKFAKAYMINVASYKNGVGYDKGWTKVDGFSENVLRYIHEIEQL